MCKNMVIPIVSGILQACYYSENGAERRKEFYFTGELCLLYSSWLTQTQANYQIEALNTVKVIQIPLELLNLIQWQPALIGLLNNNYFIKNIKKALFHIIVVPYSDFCYRPFITCFPVIFKSIF